MSTVQARVALIVAGAPTGAVNPVVSRVTLWLVHRTFWLVRLVVPAAVAALVASVGDRAIEAARAASDAADWTACWAMAHRPPR